MKLENEFLSKINRAIDELSNPCATEMLCKVHRLGEPLPSIEQMERIVNLIREILFPGFFADAPMRRHSIPHYMGVYIDELFHLLHREIYAGLCFDDAQIELTVAKTKAQQMASDFIAKLPEIRSVLMTDVVATYNGDPASKSHGEVIFCYPAIRAISNYRMAHALLKLGVPLIPRMMTEMAHSETGIDIHPQAEIGHSFTIDHGTGIVIGSTCIIGDNVKLYQGVTLGAKSFPLDAEGNPIKGIPRHPIVEDNVVIYAQATILGRVTIGANSIIGGNVWVTNHVEPNSRILQSKAKEMSFVDGAGI
ncbi:MAG: serine O-acetyltransferase EpsC [Mangrovibacterium sp.]